MCSMLPGYESRAPFGRMMRSSSDHQETLGFTQPLDPERQPVNSNPRPAAAREVVAHFANRQSFDDAVAGLTAAGFAHSDLSVLASHQSIEAAGRAGTPWSDAMLAVLGEWKVEVPLVASGAVLLAGGPVAAIIAGAVAAAVGGLAVKEVVEEVTDQPHTEDFARAVAAGNVVLWARVETAAREAAAHDILERTGGADIHVVPAAPSED